MRNFKDIRIAVAVDVVPEKVEHFTRVTRVGAKQKSVFLEV